MKSAYVAARAKMTLTRFQVAELRLQAFAQGYEGLTRDDAMILAAEILALQALVSVLHLGIVEKKAS